MRGNWFNKIMLPSLLLCGISSTLMAGPSATAGSCDTSPSTAIRAKSQPPCDFPAGATMDQLNLARFAWNTFVSLAWPAENPTVAPFKRGVPKGSAYGDSSVIVWDTFREKRELFQTRRSKTNTGDAQYVCNGVTTSGAPVKQSDAYYYYWNTPTAWDTNQAPPTTGPNPQVKACPGTPATGGVFNYLDETDEIGLAVLWQKDANPTEDNLIRYEVKLNKSYYEHIQGDQLWCTSTLDNKIGDVSGADGPAKVGKVLLPIGSNKTGDEGTILVKTAWKKLSATEKSSGEYLTKTALYYEGNSGEPCYTYGTFGLIAVHIIRKTESFPHFLFTTFEHKNNTPGQFNYANVGSAALAVNPYGIPYGNPHANFARPKTGSYPIKDNLVSPPYPANKLIKPASAVVKANLEADKVNSATVWKNYQLVGVQYKPVSAPANATTGKYYLSGHPALDVPKTSDIVRGDGFYPSYFDDQDFYLANAVVETNQRFQFFTGNFSVPTVDNVVLYKNGDPSKPRQKTVNMGGCMGCHGVAQTQGTDFSFTLNNQLSAPTSLSAGNLAETCESIAGKYNASTGACTAN
ncbi:hypothetical protein [Teredinibacter purpureus]|uniref:hypothetical protein n=1 Tax=Teredinibacter purpureus TaxID=2731756 RepID=UPI0013C4A20C|nr:hypothetical protein [Teredinibacter purpureus]